MTRQIINIPKETLEYLYWEERLSIEKIALKLGLSYSTIYSCIERHNIRRRTTFEIDQLEHGRTGITAEELRELYIDKQLPIIFIAHQLHSSTKTINRLLKQYQIPIRTRNEVQKLSAPKRLRDKDGHGRNWKGGRIEWNGYIRIWCPGHPRAEKRGNYVQEHIIIWENSNNKRLPDGWVVHHLNGIKTDNRPENLEAMSKSAHKDLAKPYKQRIRQLEARIVELEAQLKNHNLFTFPPISPKLTSSLLLGS